MTEPDETLLALTADIVSAHVAHNRVSVSDVPQAIASVYEALAVIAAPQPEPEAEKPKGAVSVRASIKPDHLVSMIDGRSYKMLRRHIGLHGYTPDSYRETFGLPRDYPMVSENYAQQRRNLALQIGLGRKPKAAARSAKSPGKSGRAKPKR